MIIQYNDRVVKLWLTFTCLSIVVMVLIGGLTRLTGSGLSMTEWKPITGWFPPTGQIAWQVEFDKYKESPEYLKINEGMSLNDFKSIYWLEYIHRIAGRITVLIYIVPLIFFLLSRKISLNKIAYFLLIAVLFFLQGFAGWYMVKSGLIDNPYVNPFRLSIHLSLAVIIYSMLFWQRIHIPSEVILFSSKYNLSPTKNALLCLLFTCFCQIFVGGMVAGLKAGLVYNSFPLMGGSIIPPELYQSDLNFDLISNPVFIQFLHRMIAEIVFFLGINLVYKSFKSPSIKLKRASVYIFFAILLQVLGGIFTLIYSLPIVLALFHQISAIFLFSTILWGMFLVKNC